MDNPGKPKKKERQKQKGSGDCNEVEYLDSYGTLLSLCTYSFKSELYVNPSCVCIGIASVFMCIWMMQEIMCLNILLNTYITLLFFHIYFSQVDHIALLIN